MVSFASPPPENNGSPIISYELQMDDGISGDFTSLVGASSNSMQTTFQVTGLIIKGRQHRFKYRAKNSVGWGPFSEESAVLAARVPDKPPQPLFLSFASGVLTIVIPHSEDNGGSAITGY